MYLDMAWPLWYFRWLMSKKRDSIKLRAPAKINLFLEILGRRANGYHDLRSVVVPVSLWDHLLIKRNRAGSSIETVIETDSTVSCEALSDGKTNIATRAADMLRREAGCREGALIRISKHIPVGGGLGGGSSDAAAVLTGLNRLWELRLSLEQLCDIGARIGCDVPALLHDGLVLMEGLGEKITRVGGNGEEFGERWLVLVNPGFSVSTRDIYARCKPPLTSERISISDMVSSLRSGNRQELAGCLFNGLRDTVFRKYPMIELAAETLMECGAHGVELSGSGATVFGIAADEEDAVRIEKDVVRRLDDSVWSKAVKMLPDGVMVAHGPLEA